MSWFSSLKAKFSPAQEINEEKIQSCLEQFSIPVSQAILKDRITQLNIEQDNLQLSIFVYENEIDHLQQLHDELSAKLAQAGVKTLNLHVVQKKKPQNTSIPPTVNAVENQTLEQAKQQYQPQQEEAPIKKAAPTQTQIKPHPHIQHVIVVASGKGGVGKSTTTVNLALALRELGLKVGVLDADIYGPSIPTMLGNEGQSPLIENEQFIPIAAYGMPVLSIGHLTGDGRIPVAWRGPKATGALMQLFNQTQWPVLDVLLIDMPPGTGDIQLTLAQRIPVSGAVIVTTPQNVALLDAQKGIELFNKVNIKILGVVENMSTHICSNCGFEEQIFGVGGGDKLSEIYHIPLLGRLPLNASIRENADQGKPSVIAKDAAYESYMEIATKLQKSIEQLPHHHDEKRIF
ncbi:Mrp/NBP35 family ATP-binding protein [Acinetobacter qingfengensis]|uniref:Iron-sulfur cluster carrier protein n=1 Tax=Acinetobacter qingfengensis TaxID=1262585 RepID=A0A1E7QXB4_9GAMM|nr:Mrp/NBP35 family ATP-binding protein [Acinetobacter qingfengensis]KAA8731608.1 Mrp/NBP35 family ATP-binding protein [Acinetobacter qingfengensis]OEY91712.1 ATP-binding protein [Acinetobacter qingfengensis]